MVVVIAQHIHVVSIDHWRRYEYMGLQQITLPDQNSPIQIQFITLLLVPDINVAPSKQHDMSRFRLHRTQHLHGSPQPHILNVLQQLPLIRLDAILLHDAYHIVASPSSPPKKVYLLLSFQPAATCRISLDVARVDFEPLVFPNVEALTGVDYMLLRVLSTQNIESVLEVAQREVEFGVNHRPSLDEQPLLGDLLNETRVDLVGSPAFALSSKQKDLSLLGGDAPGKHEDFEVDSKVDDFVSRIHDIEQMDRLFRPLEPMQFFGNSNVETVH